MTPRAKATAVAPEAVVAVPIVTDATAPALLGMSARAFREAVQRQRVPHVKLGARIIVLVEDLAALARRNVDASASQLREDGPEATTTTSHGPTVVRALSEPATADDMLERLGFRRAD